MGKNEAIIKKNDIDGEKDRYHLLPYSELESTRQEAVSAHFQHPLLFLAEVVVVMHLPSWVILFSESKGLR